jgi:AraC family transcriptional regulator
MFLRTEVIVEKMLVGKSLTMSFVNNKTAALWREFMPRRVEVVNAVSNDLYSAEVYVPGFFESFDPARKFEKWALVEVSSFNSVPDGLETLVFPAGLYAVFLHKGPASEGARTYRYIFMDWLPASGYVLDNRPHFAIMGVKYKSDSEESEEEIWIPVV